MTEGADWNCKGHAIRKWEIVNKSGQRERERTGDVRDVDFIEVGVSMIG